MVVVVSLTAIHWEKAMRMTLAAYVVSFIPISLD